MSACLHHRDSVTAKYLHHPGKFRDHVIHVIVGALLAFGFNMLSFLLVQSTSSVTTARTAGCFFLLPVWPLNLLVVGGGRHSGTCYIRVTHWWPSQCQSARTHF